MLIRVEAFRRVLHIETGRVESAEAEAAPADTPYPMLVYADPPSDPVGVGFLAIEDRRRHGCQD